MSVRNRTPAQLQISAEQILSEVRESKEKSLQQKEEGIRDVVELKHFQKRKRTEFEEALRRKRSDMRQWMRYAQWEISQSEYVRARSIFERALAIMPSYIPLWLRYVDTEMARQNFMHARGILSRATRVMPRVDKFWILSASVEQIGGSVESTQDVFEKWIQWQSGIVPWQLYLQWLKTIGPEGSVRAVYARASARVPSSELFTEWAEYETSIGHRDLAREVFTQSVDWFVSNKGTEGVPVQLLIRFSQWEAENGEIERARALLKFGVQHLQDADKPAARSALLEFERKSGDSRSLRTALSATHQDILSERLSANSRDIDSWWALVTLTIDLGTSEDVRAVFERAVSGQPATLVKPAWTRYVYMWLRYAQYCELVLHDVQSAKNVYDRALSTIPHSKFTFAKLWYEAAKWEVRNGTLAKARLLLGRALGLSGKPKLYQYYIEMESKLQEYGRCRKLYEKYIARHSDRASAWNSYAKFEDEAGEEERVRAIYELALEEKLLDDRSSVWLAYTEHTANRGDFELARKLYRRMLTETPSDPASWLAYAMFELSTGVGNDDDAVDLDALQRARAVFDEAERILAEISSLRMQVFEARVEFEKAYGDQKSLTELYGRAPKITGQWQVVDGGSQALVNEYVFPQNDEAIHRLLANAQKWAGVS